MGFWYIRSLTVFRSFVSQSTISSEDLRFPSSLFIRSSSSTVFTASSLKLQIQPSVVEGGSSGISPLTVCRRDFSRKQKRSGWSSAKRTAQHSFFSKSRIVPPYWLTQSRLRTPLRSMTAILLELQLIAIRLGRVLTKSLFSRVTCGNVYLFIAPLRRATKMYCSLAATEQIMSSVYYSKS